MIIYFGNKSRTKSYQKRNVLKRRESEGPIKRSQQQFQYTGHGLQYHRRPSPELKYNDESRLIVCGV